MIDTFMIKNPENPITIDFSYKTRAGETARGVIHVDEITRIKPGCKAKLLYENTYRDFYMIEGMIRAADFPIYVYHGPESHAIQFTPVEAIATLYSYLRANCEIMYNRCVKNYDREYDRIVKSIGL